VIMVGSPKVCSKKKTSFFGIKLHFKYIIAYFKVFLLVILQLWGFQ